MSWQSDLAEQATAIFAADPRIAVVFLGGSLGAGTGDAWSDVDLILAAAPDHHGAVVADLGEMVGRIAPLAMWRQVHPPLPLYTAVLSGWRRLDLTVTVPDRLTYARDRVTPLHDPQDLAARLIPSLPNRTPDPARVYAIAEEFLRICGLLPLGHGRQEYVVGKTGYGLLRGLLIDLLIEAQAPPVPPGALSLSRVLPAEDVALLAALPAPRADRDELLAANLALYQAFLPRARALAAACG
ncbi:MAG: hypothetical protein ACK53I_13405, partial [Phenylobacterium sp.]